MIDLKPGKLAASADSLLDAARTAAGLGDFGAEDFYEGYVRLLAAYDASEDLSVAGLGAALDQLQLFLRARLRAVEGWKQRKGAPPRLLAAPLVITGLPRSGTTALHKVLSMDSQFQGLEHWIAAAPTPRPPRSLWAAQAGYRDARELLARQSEIATEMVSEHGMAVEDVEETYYVLAQSFCANHFAVQTPLPAYDAWYQAQDVGFTYEHVRRVLALIGADDARTWLLKNPSDAFDIDALLAVFPDARIVQTHRDPLQALPSLLNVLRGQFRLFLKPEFSLGGPMRREAGYWAEAMRRMEAARRRHPGQFCDVYFGRFVHDQLSAVAHIYETFSLTLSAESEQAMRRWLTENPRQSTAMQRFTPEDFGMRTGDLLAMFEGYRQRHDFA